MESIKTQAENKLSEKDYKRYYRQIVLPELGIEGQKKLKNASVLIIGAGGLGSPVSLYLAAAGVGKIGLVDFDKVSLSNLQRQILFTTNEVGEFKSEIAAEKLSSLNTDIEIISHNCKLNKENIFSLIENYDIIADGTDNFAAKYLINDACVIRKKPFVYGSILRFSGQVSFFDVSNGPCYRCLYPEPPTPGEVPSCAEAGVLGVLPGIIGSIQANEIIKFIIGKGELLNGRLLLVDALKMKFTEIQFSKNPNCPVCSEESLMNELVEYYEHCPDSSENGINNYQIPLDSKWEISVFDLKRKMDDNEKFFLLDVREEYENHIATLGGYLIPLRELPNRVDELNSDDEIIIYCRSGKRSHIAVNYLRDVKGFSNVKNLTDGILEWSDKIDSSIQKY